MMTQYSRYGTTATDDTSLVRYIWYISHITQQLHGTVILRTTATHVTSATWYSSKARHGTAAVRSGRYTGYITTAMW